MASTPQVHRHVPFNDRGDQEKFDDLRKEYPPSGNVWDGKRYPPGQPAEEILSPSSGDVEASIQKLTDLFVREALRVARNQ